MLPTLRPPLRISTFLINHFILLSLIHPFLVTSTYHLDRGLLLSAPFCASVPLPSQLTLPKGFHRSWYPTVTALCAAAVYGGQPYGNMGGKCFPEIPIFDFDHSIADSELIDDPAIRQVCYAFCWCKITGPSPGRLETGGVYEVRRGHRVDLRNGGIVVHENGQTLTIQPPTEPIQLLPGEHAHEHTAPSPAQEAGACATSPRVGETCQQTPAPAPSDDGASTSGSSGSHDMYLPSCGRSCDSMASCSSDFDAECAACIQELIYQDIEPEYLDPVFPTQPSAYGHSWVCGNKHGRRKVRRRDKMGLRERGGADLQPPGLLGMLCRCNGTFVDERCCDAPDGMVWGGGPSGVVELM